MTRGAVALLAVLWAACAPDVERIGSGKARLPQADRVVELPKGEVLELVPGQPPAPAGKGPVRIVADGDATWQEVAAAMDAVRAAGGEPWLAMRHRTEVKALPPFLPRVADPALRIIAEETRACIWIPDAMEGVCVSRGDKKHIDRTGMRQTLRQVIDETGISRVRMVVWPTTSYANAIRAIDGARTCCFETPVEISLEPL